MPLAPSSQAEILIISGAGPPRNIVADPKGMIIGRGETCGIILEDRQISRHHARLYRDPFGRWIIEDLGSRNGVWVEGRQIKTCALGPSEHVVIGPFTLRLSEPLDRQIRPGEKITTVPALVEIPPETTLIQVPPDAHETLSGRRLKDLDAIGDCLAHVTSSGALYPEACRCLAKAPDTAALVLRLISAAGSRETPPEILACHSSVSGVEAGGLSANFKISRRVIQTVRESKRALLASNIRGGGGIGLTVMDEVRPRAVCCAPITVDEDWMDVLYVNLAEDQAEEGVLDFVRALSRQIGLTGQSILRAEEAAKRHLLDQQLTMARDIQLSLIPKSLNFSPRVDLALTYEPALWVGGDYCDVWPLADGRIAFALGDVSGKGLPAAMMMANLQAALRTAIHFRSDLAEAMAYLNQHLKRYTPAEAFVTMVTGLLDPATGRLEYLNAGHPLPLLVSASASISALGEPRNLPLGMVEATFTQDEAVLQPGTRLVLVTDGVTDALSPGGEKFGSPRLQEVLSRGATNSSRNVVDAVARAVEEFRGARPPQDDVTILAVLNRGGA